MKNPALDTIAVHAGQSISPPDYTPVYPPIHNSVAFTYDHMDDVESVFAGTQPGYVYTRYANPTTDALQCAIAQLEGTDEAVACASGMAALHMALLAAGAHSGNTVLAAQDIYGGTYSLLVQVLAKQGVRVAFADPSDPIAMSQAIDEHAPAVLLVETISNPLLRIADVAALAKLIHTAGGKLIVDSTFATPCLFRPAQHGADFIVHSATKYLSGHGDVTAGVVCASRIDCTTLRELQKSMGAILGPNEAWLVLRGMRTLALRLREQCRNALDIAHFLTNHQQIARVYYPGLTSHPQYALARTMFDGDLYGGIVSFEIAGANRAQVFRFMDALQLVTPATSLGDVQSLVMYPPHSSHRAFSLEQRKALGIHEGFLRLSVGIENVSDIIADLAQALEATF